MEKISTVVIDDDSLFQTILSGFIDKTDSLGLIEVFGNPVDAINYLSQNKVDLIFLDVEMPEMTGLQFIEALDYKPEIILVTNNDAYAVSAFAHNVTDYLLKPLDDYSRFLQAVNRAKEGLTSEAKNDYIFIKENNKLIKIKFQDIHYVEAYGDYVKIYTKDKYHITLSTLKSIGQKLPKADFLQIHRSFLVRLDMIDSIEGNNLQIKKYSVPFSKSMRESILERILS